jgi:iron complex outermembrane recepter protein
VDRVPGLGDLEQNTSLATVGPTSHVLQAYNATLTADLGKAELTSTTGYTTTELEGNADASFFSGIAQTQFGVTGVREFNHITTDKFTQEVRLSMPLGKAVEWRIGAFYDHEDSEWLLDYLAEDPATGEVPGSVVSFLFPTKYEEYALFTDATFHVTERFDVQVGLRQSEIEQEINETVAGAYYVPNIIGLPNPVVTPTANVSESAFTYLIAPRLRLTPNLMAYARIASGYGPGGVTILLNSPQTPTFDPDRTQNYEIGLKGDLFGQLLTFDASLYYITWKDIQLSLNDPVSGFTYTTNGSEARSQGLELTVESWPTQSLAIAASMAFNDTELTQDFPIGAAYGVKGDRLPYGSRFSGNVSLEQEFPAWGGTTGFVGGAVSYVGERRGVFTGTPDRQVFPSYTKVDLSAGVRTGSWSASLYVDNLADERGMLTGGVGTAIPTAFTYIRPRTLGVSFSKNF